VSLENNNFNRIISKYHTKLNEVALHRQVSKVLKNVKIVKDLLPQTLWPEKKEGRKAGRKGGRKERKEKRESGTERLRQKGWKKVEKRRGREGRKGRKKEEKENKGRKEGREGGRKEGRWREE
jgi:hypothetical protein